MYILLVIDILFVHGCKCKDSLCFYLSINHYLRIKLHQSGTAAFLTDFDFRQSPGMTGLKNLNSSHFNST